MMSSPPQPPPLSKALLSCQMLQMLWMPFQTP
uniref:Uncharacterized protein n=1 Tax=Anguilla anguilla TaxID=7936 RepID=A0A0E9QQY5_ANGAN